MTKNAIIALLENTVAEAYLDIRTAVNAEHKQEPMPLLALLKARDKLNFAITEMRKQKRIKRKSNELKSNEKRK